MKGEVKSFSTRALHMLPRQGTKTPWRLHQNLHEGSKDDAVWQGGRRHDGVQGSSTVVAGLFRPDLLISSHFETKIPPTAVGGLFRSFLQNRSTTQTKIPPTVVGGLFRSILQNRSTRGTYPTIHCLAG